LHIDGFNTPSFKVYLAKPGTLQNTKWQSCIDACMRCAEACEFCATQCLREEDVKMMATCVQLCRECAEVCWSSAALMSMDSQFAKQFCKLCADVCDACAQECEKHDVDHCKQCAHVATVLKNVEKWQAALKANPSSFFAVNGGVFPSLFLLEQLSSFMKSACKLRDTGIIIVAITD
jgi:hypothetical protein